MIEYLCYFQNKLEVRYIARNHLKLIIIKFKLQLNQSCRKDYRHSGQKKCIIDVRDALRFISSHILNCKTQKYIFLQPAKK